MSKVDPRLPASVVMSLGLAGCGLFGPCLSLVDSTGPCLSLAHTGDSDDCDTADSTDTDCPEDTEAADRDEQSRAEVTNRVLESGALPPDVAARLTD